MAYDYTLDAHAPAGSLAKSLARTLRAQVSRLGLFDNARRTPPGQRFSTRPSDADDYQNVPGSGYQYQTGEHGQHD